ncbi:MAG: hypothetical protein LBR10_11670 [Prevotellaceae bacterium]|jgi:hypothetical protein|nr:hypothetical protein [Prevotellaceae bacterium]
MKKDSLIYELDDIGFVGMQLSEEERKKSRDVFRAYVQASRAQKQAESDAKKRKLSLRKITAAEP